MRHCAVTHVVDDELRDELTEAEPLKETRQSLNHERVRRAMLLVEERVDGPSAATREKSEQLPVAVLSSAHEVHSPEQDRRTAPRNVAERELVKLLRLLLVLAEDVLVLDRELVRQARPRRALDHLDVDRFRNLPRLDREPDGAREEDGRVGLFGRVDEVEEDDGLGKDVGEDGADRDADEFLLVAPVRDVARKGEEFEAVQGQYRQ
jgi:hypothetical protein